MNRYAKSVLLITVTTAGVAAVGTLLGPSNIDPDQKFSWSENTGWWNWRDADATDQGVLVGDDFLTGYVWGENIGWIDVGAGDGPYANTTGLDFGVNILPSGDLDGYAWSENAGWVNFGWAAETANEDRARFDAADERFRGYAWGENIGWVNLDDSVHYVAAEVAAPPDPPLTPDPDPFGSHVDKNRYISMVIPTSVVASDEETAIRVRLTSLHHPDAPEIVPDFSDWEGHYRWVNSLNETHTCPDSPNFPGTTFRCAVLGCDPEYRAWAKELGGETLHVTGAAIVPSSDYEVALLAASCAGNEASCAAVSTELLVNTCQFGDVDPLADGLVVLDIARVVDHVKGKPYPTIWPPESGTALFKPRVHLRPNVPDALGENVGVLDIATAVDAVKGNAYWHFGEFGPCTDACPGEAACP